MERKVFKIQPLVGISNLKFGQSRQESRDLMQSKFSERSTDKMVDLYYNAAFQIFFDDQEQIEYIEISREKNVEVLFEETNIFKTPADELIKQISQEYSFDENDSELGYSFVFSEIELSFWRPVIPKGENDQDGKYFSTVGVGKKGYYKN
jgi:hypothetical protein